jgi:hypothetical protein
MVINEFDGVFEDPVHDSLILGIVLQYGMSWSLCSFLPRKFHFYYQSKTVYNCDYPWVTLSVVMLISDLKQVF